MHGVEYGYLDDYNIVTCALDFVKMIYVLYKTIFMDQLSCLTKYQKNWLSSKHLFLASILLAAQ